MVKFFVIQIRLGRITIEQVPERYREAVISVIAESGK